MATKKAMAARQTPGTGGIPRTVTPHLPDIVQRRAAECRDAGVYAQRASQKKPAAM
jgi:hypothetical protein